MALNSLHGSRSAKILWVLTLALVVNSAYVAAFGDPTLFYVANALLHPVLGLLAAFFAICVIRHRKWLQGATGWAACISFVGSLGFGIYLIFEGMTRPHSLELYAHVTFSLFALFFGLILFRAWWKNAGDAQVLRQTWTWTIGVATVCAIFYGSAALYHHFVPDPEYIIRNPSTAPLTMYEEGGGKNSLVFPSSATTSNGKTIPAEFFQSSEGCKKCHADIYAQWNSSTHHFASFNNQWYRKAVEYMQDVDGIKPSLWCGGCHDHALVFTDMMQTHPIREIEHTPEGQVGLACMSCHSIVHVKSTMGQGNYVMEYPALDRLASSPNPAMRWLHDFAVKLNPKPHRNVFLKPFHRDRRDVAEFCSVCHKVHLDVPVNNYRWIRGFDDYDNWQASGVSGQGARSFYYPPKPLVCVDCHMPLVKSNDFANIDGMVHSHRFAAANTAVPTANGDEVQVKAVEAFLKGALSVDVFGVAKEPEGQISERAVNEGPQLSSSFAQGEESSAGMTASMVSGAPPAPLMAPLNRGTGHVHRGDTVRVEVVVRTLKVGHFFPGGTVDAFDCWLELKAVDNKGHVIFWSGEAHDNGKGPVDPGAHFYRSLQLDAHGNPINKRNAWATRATMYARLIPPGAADTVHFRLHIPKDCGDTITLTAKLDYRKFAWWNTQWAFAGVRDPANPHPNVAKGYDDGKWVFTGSLSDVSAAAKEIPDVPIVVIAQDGVTVPVLPENTQAFTEDIKLNSGDRSRWNDYGIGLLLQGDLKGAERAFRNVTAIDPKYADGWVNIARALVQEGNTEAAKPLLQKAIELDPDLASAHYFAGLAYKADGNYPAAYDEFAKAAARYPYDRVVRNQMGRMLFLQREYQLAVNQFDKTLSVDPEDLEAHYNLMLCYRGLGNDELSSREEKLYLRFKADESSRAITGPYKLKHPDDNNETLPIHEHVSEPLDKVPGSLPYIAEHRTKALPTRRRAERKALRAANTGGAAYQ
jgi:tetratricopeptide (TPR) repeat protein